MSFEEICNKIQNVIDKSDKALTKKTIGTSVRDAISASLVSIARQHHQTIFHLVQTHKQYNSAFALLRPLVDATYRAVWIMIISTDNQVKRIGDGDRNFKSTQELAKMIDRQERITIFHDRYYGNSALLHGFTHAGLELIGRQMKNGYIEPNFEDKELAALLIESSTHYCLLLYYYGRYIDDTDLIYLGGNAVKNISAINID